MHAPAERAAVAAALFIVPEIRQPGPRIAFFRQQGQQRHDVGLLHHLGSLRPLPSEDDVEGYCAVGVSGEVDLFEIEETGELLEQPAFRREAGEQRLGRLRPLLKFGVVEVELFRKFGPATRPTIAQQRGDLDATPDVPAGHDIGIGAVVDVLVIFVRTDDAADMAPAVGLGNGSAGPEPCGFQKNFGAGFDHEGVIPCRLPVLPDRVGDIGRDMLLLRAAEHLDEITIGADELLGSGLLAGIR